MLNLENQMTAAEIAEMNAEIAIVEHEISNMRTLALNTHEIAEKLNLIAAGVILLGNAEYGITWGFEYSDPDEPGVDVNTVVALGEYNTNIKPFADALHELQVGGMVEYITLDKLLDMLDRLVVTLEEYNENGISGYDEKAGEVIKKALRARKRRKNRR